MATKRKTTSPAAEAAPAAAPGAAPSLQFIDLDVIDALPQVRTTFDEEALNELAASIKLRGMLQPILLRSGQGKLGNRYTVIAGERRLRAARLAGLASVPALVGDVPENLVAEMQLVENIQREQLSLAETAAGVLQLFERFQAQKPVADLLGKSVPWVSKHLSVATKLSWYADNLLKSGDIEDLDLLMTIDQMWHLNKMYPRGNELVEKIKAKKAGRPEARALLAEMRAELADERKQRADVKRQTQQGTLDLEQKKIGPPPWDADIELDKLHDVLSNAEHKPIEELLSHLEKQQLAEMADLFKDEWEEGKKLNKATELVKLRGMARFLEASYDDISFRTAAFILGTSAIKRTVHDLAAELHQLMHGA